MNVDEFQMREWRMNEAVTKRLEQVGLGTVVNFPKYEANLEPDPDVVEKMREAMDNMVFKPPVQKDSLFVNYTSDYVDERSWFRKFLHRLMFWRRWSWVVRFRMRKWFREVE